MPDLHGLLQAVPTSATAITTGGIKLKALYVFNPTAGDLTFTLTSTDEIAIFSDKTIAGGGSLMLESDRGIPMDGAKWSGGSGLTGAYEIETAAVSTT